MIRNIHRRRIPAPANEVGALIDSLASDHDRLWPRDRWPPIRLDRGLRVGSSGGHGPILYSVATHEPGRSVQFEFAPRCGLIGFHKFSVESSDGSGTILRHELQARTRGWMSLGWPLAMR